MNGVNIWVSSRIVELVPEYRYNDSSSESMRKKVSLYRKTCVAQAQGTTNIFGGVTRYVTYESERRKACVFA